MTCGHLGGRLKALLRERRERRGRFQGQHQRLPLQCHCQDLRTLRRISECPTSSGEASWQTRASRNLPEAALSQNEYATLLLCQASGRAAHITCASPDRVSQPSTMLMCKPVRPTHALCSLAILRSSTNESRRADLADHVLASTSGAGPHASWGHSLNPHTPCNSLDRVG